MLRNARGKTYTLGCLLVLGAGTACDLPTQSASEPESLILKGGSFPQKYIEPRRIRIQAIMLSDDDGSRRYWHPYNFSQNLRGVISSVNQIFAPAHIQFDYDPAEDFELVANTLLNRTAPPFSDWRDVGNDLANQYRGKLVIFFRWGPNPDSATGNGKGFPPVTGHPVPEHFWVSPVNVKFVLMPNQWSHVIQSAARGNGPLGGFLAHELGHHLGLFHTFPGQSMSTIYGPKKNRQVVNTLSGQLYVTTRLLNFIDFRSPAVALDGDLLSDTPPDPGPVLYDALVGGGCAGVDPVTGQDTVQLTVTDVRGARPVDHTFQADRTNVMGYYGKCSPVQTFSPQQIQRMNEVLDHPARSYLLRYR